MSALAECNRAVANAIASHLYAVMSTRRIAEMMACTCEQAREAYAFSVCDIVREECEVGLSQFMKHSKDDDGVHAWQYALDLSAAVDAHAVGDIAIVCRGHDLDAAEGVRPHVLGAALTLNGDVIDWAVESTYDDDPRILTFPTFTSQLPLMLAWLAPDAQIGVTLFLRSLPPAAIAPDTHVRILTDALYFDAPAVQASVIAALNTHHAQSCGNAVWTLRRTDDDEPRLQLLTQRVPASVATLYAHKALLPDVHGREKRQCDSEPDDTDEVRDTDARSTDAQDARGGDDAPSSTTPLKDESAGLCDDMDMFNDEFYASGMSTNAMQHVQSFFDASGLAYDGLNAGEVDDTMANAAASIGGDANAHTEGAVAHAEESSAPSPSLPPPREVENTTSNDADELYAVESEYATRVLCGLSDMSIEAYARFVRQRAAKHASLLAQQQRHVRDAYACAQVRECVDQFVSSELVGALVEPGAPAVTKEDAAPSTSMDAIMMDDAPPSSRVEAASPCV